MKNQYTICDYPLPFNVRTKKKEKKKRKRLKLGYVMYTIIVRVD